MAEPTELEIVKQYMRYEENDEDLLIQSLIQASKTYLATAGAERTDLNADLYDLCVKGLVLHWFDHRDDVAANVPIPLGLRLMINQVKTDSVICHGLDIVPPNPDPDPEPGGGEDA